MKGKNENIKADSTVCSDLLYELDFYQTQNKGDFCVPSGTYLHFLHYLIVSYSSCGLARKYLYTSIKS